MDTKSLLLAEGVFYLDISTFFKEFVWSKKI